MARIIYTGLVESIRGSIQGTTFQRNAYGYTIKAKPKTVNPNRYLQAGRKSSFADQVRKWRALSETNRTKWQTYSESFPIPSRLNPDSDINGFNYFVKWHSYFNQGGNGATLADPGTTQGTWSLNEPQVNLVMGDLYIELVYTSTATDWQAYLYATPQIPLGQEWIRVTPRFVQQGSTAISGELDFTAGYTLAFGQLPIVGQWLGIKIVFIREGNAQMVEYSPAQYEIY